jgi:hypothetical protein
MQGLPGYIHDTACVGVEQRSPEKVNILLRVHQAPSYLTIGTRGNVSRQVKGTVLCPMLLVPGMSEKTNLNCCFIQ